jgi:hypothetical protein
MTNSEQHAQTPTLRRRSRTPINVQIVEFNARFGPGTTFNLVHSGGHRYLREDVFDNANRLNPNTGSVQSNYDFVMGGVEPYAIWH